jgi:hypothetical protein
MFASIKTRLTYCIIVFVCAGLFLTSCEMGLGPPVDLEPASLQLTNIKLADGTVIPIEGDGDKLYVGQGILVDGDGILELNGTARDNIAVDQILVEETGSNAEIIDGKNPSWNRAVIGKRGTDGYQEWSITLDGIKKGERVFTITAYDKHKNIGINSVKQLTLLVDTDPPFVESCKIERPGLQIDLLPRTRLEALDPNLFEHIDYFQNEYFTIRASIFHVFPLSGVTLNLRDEQGNYVFAQGRERTDGTLYTPAWYISAADLIAANSDYMAGRHYLSVVITAVSEAGNSQANLLLSLCWYPEADNPRVQMAVESDQQKDDPDADPLVTPFTWTIEVNKVLAVNVFDDDNVDQIYTAMIPKSVWDDELFGTDQEKLDWLRDNRDSLAGVTWIERKEVARKTIGVPVEVGSERGDYRLVVLALDKKEGDADRKWGSNVFTVKVMQEGIPTITIKSPASNTAPSLTDGKFTLEGSVINMDPVEFLKIVWVPYGLANDQEWNPEKQMEEAEKTLLEEPGSNANIKLWNLDLDTPTNYEVSGKIYKQQTFSKTFDIFSDFKKYNNANEIENEPKFFMLYTKGKTEDNVFEYFNLLAYTTPPTIAITKPAELSSFGQGKPISFTFTVKGALGIPIDENSIKVVLVADSGDEDLNKPQYNSVDGTYTTEHSGLSTPGDYRFRITAVDKLGNPAEPAERYIKVETLPVFQKFTTSHSETFWFSSEDSIIIKASFNEPVNPAFTKNSNSPPWLVLNGFNDSAPHYAYYDSDEGGTLLSFKYKVRKDDYAPSGLTVTVLNLGTEWEMSDIGADFGTRPDASGKIINFTSADSSDLSILKVDGISPEITNIVITGNNVDEDGDTVSNPPYWPWHKAGDELTINVNVDKPIRVLGSPQFILQFRSAAKQATFERLINGDTTMVFKYTIQAGDNAEPVRVRQGTCLTDLDNITDKTGIATKGNTLSLGNGTIGSDINVDTDPPGMLGVFRMPSPANQKEQFQIKTAAGSYPHPDGGANPNVSTVNLESGAKVEYTVDGINFYEIQQNRYWWEPPETTGQWISTSGDDAWSFIVEGDGSKIITARQIDRAGNIGALFPSFKITLGDFTDLLTVSCSNPDGAYGLGSTLTFRLIFSGKVYNEGAAATYITIKGGTTSNGDPQRLIFDTKTLAQADFSLTKVWTPPANLVFDPVIIESIVLGGVKSEADGSSVSGIAIDPDNIDNIMAAYNDPLTGRPGLSVMTKKPTITEVNGQAVASMNSAVISPAAGQSTVTLKFDHPVSPEKGMITVRPASEWLIPPVLSSDDYYKVSNSNALSPTQKTALSANYLETTHGLKIKPGASVMSTYYIPDIETKYVLAFTQGLDNAALRPIFETAEYMWQKIESVTVQGGGTDTITLNLEQLADGRQWKIEIDDGAFLDRAGNTTDAWSSDMAAPAGAGTNGYFRSQKVATPVIRVNRVSNNNWNIAPTENRIEGTKGTATEVTSRVNVQYRIDCETPGAVITYSTFNSGIDTITTAMTSAATYKADVADGLQNSSIPDITASQYILMEADTLYPGTTGGTTGTITNINTYNCTIGDTELYTARKDYIAAKATLAGLTASAKGYEGAFKTLIVYRNPPAGGGTLGTNRFVKTEATNTRNGAVTISGFPMDYNDRTGKSSKYTYQNSPAATIDDWIWISWEIVSEFWHVGMIMQDGTPNSEFTHDAWNPFNNDFYNHNFRKYGNWGLRVGN